jgi:hypothetical protein
MKMRMTKAQIKVYNQQFNAEMAEMTVSECRRWNPHLTKGEAGYRIAQAKSAVSIGNSGNRNQQALF